MVSPNILWERHDSIALITLNNPEKRNVLSFRDLSLLSDIFARIQKDGDLRAVILTGAGNDYFCVGVDRSELVEAQDGSMSEPSRCVQALCHQIEQSHVPIIAAVNGLVEDDGCTLVFACHLNIVSVNTTFRWESARPDLRKLCGRHAGDLSPAGSAVAKDPLPLTATTSAEEALGMGLVNQVVGPERLLSESLSLASLIAQLAPLAISGCMQAVTCGMELTLTEGLALEAKLFASLFATADMREGTRAFLEKRPPVFSGS